MFKDVYENTMKGMPARPTFNQLKEAAMQKRASAKLYVRDLLKQAAMQKSAGPISDNVITPVERAVRKGQQKLNEGRAYLKALPGRVMEDITGMDKAKADWNAADAKAKAVVGKMKPEANWQIADMLHDASWDDRKYPSLEFRDKLWDMAIKISDKARLQEKYKAGQAKQQPYGGIMPGEDVKSLVGKPLPGSFLRALPSK